MLVRMGVLQGVLVLVMIAVFDLKHAWGSLRYSQSPRSMKPQSDPASRGPPLSSQGFWNPLQKASPFQSHDSREFAQEPLGVQEKQVLQGPVKPLDWRFPIVPEVQSEVAVDFQLRQPVTPSSVAIQCGENQVLVEVQQDLFSNGQLIQPSGLSLGGCPVVGQVSNSRVLLFEYELQDCNSVLMMTEDELVYTFALTYTPEALADTPITRADGAVVRVVNFIISRALNHRQLRQLIEDYDTEYGDLLMHSEGRSQLNSKLYLMAKTSIGGHCGVVSMLVRMGVLQGVLVLVMIAVFDLKHAWGSLRYSQSPGSMKPQSDPASRGPPLSSQGFWNPLQKASPFQSHDSREFAQEPLGVQEKQVLQGPVKPLDWRFPIVPEVQSEVAVDFQLRQPVTPSSVAIQCGENQVLVKVQQDLFSNGQLIQPSGLSLGGCPVVGQDSNSRVLLFEYELQDCNSVLMMTEDELVYTFALTYTPEVLAGTPITRADGAVVGVQCHYQRFHNVSSNALRPTWVPYASTEFGEEVLLFSLKLMMDDWSYERPSNSYFLGDIINIEASVKVYNHVPLRVFVDHCVATQVPDVTALPRYSFIENNG
ncbi:uncharacterized protein LOC131553150 [Onychostoma macrolepis]|uniref:uncharacterized protein LOC131553150 n=1 Tax=Onychostoma macrolepis TaxID=369639 RepID=UPI002729ED2A|nr:uncharacterized protein LOC131553150 [Onychostoma macrolepis]